jgi:hypothetical protein
VRSGRRGSGEDVPTAFSSMMFSALVLAADMFAGATGVVEKNLRSRNEMMGKCSIAVSRTAT